MSGSAAAAAAGLPRSPPAPASGTRAADGPAAAGAPPSRGYAGFGSFMQERSLEELLAVPEAEYVPPPLPWAPAADDAAGGDDGDAGAVPLALGLERRGDFLLDFSWTFLNHGAFGAAVRPSFERAQAWRARCEAQPLRGLDRELLPAYADAVRLAARHVGASPADVVLCANATAALSAAVLGAPLGPGDCAFSLSTGYGSVKKMLALACARAGCAHVEAPLRFPLCGDAAVVAAVAASLPPNAALVVLDAVASNTALRLPVASLVALVRARCPARCRVVVDAAHLLGAEPLPAGGFPALGADVVAANCHKWLCAHRGCAVLWASAGARAGGGLPPPVVSHGLGAGFASEWAWDGNRDYAPLLALGPALEWWGRVGPERGRAYMAATLRAAVLLLVRRWGTHPLLPPSLWPSAMACVRLPFDALPQQRGGGDGAAAAAPRPAGPGADCGGGGGDDDNALLARPPPAGDGPATGGGAKEVQDFLFGRRVEVPVKCVQGHLYVRLSAHVYNVEADYQRLAEEVLRAAGWGG